MKNLKWIGITLLLAMVTAVTVNGSFGDQSIDGKRLYIVQSEFEQDDSGLSAVSPNRKLLPITDVTPEKETVQLLEQFSVTDKSNNTVDAILSTDMDMYTAENVLDHIVVVTNTGNHVGYVRTWFAFEMGDLTEDEFKESVILNKNLTQWTWKEFAYGVQISGKRYAVVCTEYNDVLEGGETTAPSLLQILLKNDVSNDLVNKLDADGNGKFEVHAYSQVVSDEGAWSQITNEPWNKE